MTRPQLGSSVAKRFVLYVLFFAVGCWVGSSADLFGWVPCMVAVVLLLAALFALSFVWERLRFVRNVWCYHVFLVVVALLLGLSAAAVRNPLVSQSHYSRHSSVGDRTLMVVSLQDRPHRVGDNDRFLAKVSGIVRNDSLCPVGGKLLLYIDTSLHLDQGDRLLVAARYYPVPESANPNAFNLRRYWHARSVDYRAWLSPYEVNLLPRRSAGIVERLRNQRTSLVAAVQSTSLSPSQKGLMQALVLGDRSAPGEATETAFRNAGITHFLCVSGLHVGIVAFLLLLLLRPLRAVRFGRPVSAFLVVAGVWMFVLLTGSAPSTVRAAVMFSFLAVSRLWHQPPPAINAVAFSALVILMFSPALVHDMGFQLSYAAVSALVVFTPALKRRVHLTLWVESRLSPVGIANPRLRQMLVYPHLLLLRILAGLTDCFIAAVVAQLATLPLSLYYFHQFPVYFLLANIVVIPFASLLLGAMALLLVLLCCGLHPLFMERLVSSLLSGLQSFVAWVSSLPGATIQGIYYDRLMLVLGIVAVLVAAYALYRRRWLPAALSLVCVIAIVAHSFVVEHRCSNQRQWVVYQHRQPTVELFCGNEALVLCGTSGGTSYLDYLLKNNEIAHCIKQRTVKTVALPIVMTTSSGSRFLVAAGRRDYYRSNLVRLQSADTLILVNPSRRGEEVWTEKADIANVPVLNISKQGSVVRNF